MTRQPRLSRGEIAKISEVEGLCLSKVMKEAFREFDRRNLTAAERREEIIKRFRPKEGKA